MSSSGEWVLMGTMQGSRRIWSVPITNLPFRIGRRPGLEMTLHSQAVSVAHAEIYESSGSLRLRDLRSTNGTFVNRKRITDATIDDGDILHFAEFEFRLARQGRRTAAIQVTAVLDQVALPQHFSEKTRELAELLHDGAVTTLFQPIVELPAGNVVVGYEALGRGLHDRLPESPVELFRISASMGAEVALSRLFQDKAIEQAGKRTNLNRLFLNTHPAELSEPSLMASMERLHALASGLRLTVEIHEAAIVNVARVATLRARLSEMGIGLAYDDFGAGQARLLELAEVPPDYLKFDARFIRHIEGAPSSKRRLLKSLIAMARDLGVNALAEGVETPDEADVCAEIGFTHAQGFHFGVPRVYE
ncbi:MAG: EAL domain-containing protein [Vicinamibacteria bacterium]|nr:EAL domain-containing protein [Vicinamibacteria bacterium]